MTYRSDGGATCASCGRHFTPDDLQLDASGGWICAECTRQNGSAETAVSLEKGLRARRRMQRLGSAIVVAVLLLIGWRIIAKHIQQGREARFAQETHDRVKKRVDTLRAGRLGKTLTQEKQCDMDDIRRRTSHDRKIPYVESSRLDGSTGWFVASEDVEQLLSFEKNPDRGNAALASAALERFEKSGVLMLLVPTKSTFESDAIQAHWHGHAVLVDPIDLTPLCSQPIAVDDSITEAASTLTHAAKNALTSMAAGDLELRF